VRNLRATQPRWPCSDGQPLTPVAGAPDVVLLPPACDGPLNFETGNHIYHFNEARLCSCHTACTELDVALAAASTARQRPSTSSDEGLGLYLAAILAKHGISALQVYGACVGCDAGGITGAGAAKVAPALYAATGVGDADVDSLAATLAAGIGPQYRTAIAVEWAATVAAEGAPAAALAVTAGGMPAIISCKIRRIMVYWRQALTFDSAAGEVRAKTGGMG